MKSRPFPFRPLKSAAAAASLSLLIACTSPGMQALEDPQAASDCAWSRAGLTPPADYVVPTVEWQDARWQNARGEWVNEQFDAEGLYGNANTLYVYDHFHVSRTLVHAMTHAMQAALGEAYNETEARKAARWRHHCFIFDKKEG